MGKFDKSRLSLPTTLTTTTATTNSASSLFSDNIDLRLKLQAKKNQVLDARQILNKKKHQIQQKQHLVTSIKRHLFQNNNNNNNNNTDQQEQPLSGSLLIMKTVDEDTGGEKRLYKVIQNYNELNNKKHIVFANSDSTLITVNNDLSKRGLNNNNNVDLDDEDIDDVEDEDEGIDLNEGKFSLNNKNRFQIKKNFNINTGVGINKDNFKIQTINSGLKRTISGNNNNNNNKINDDDVEMEVDVQKPTSDNNNVHSPIQGYRLIVSNLHPNVTEDDILELFSAIGPIKRAKFLKKGLADVVFVKLEDARNAVSSYNNRLLDGREIKIELVTKIPVSEKLAIQTPPPQTATITTPPVINYQQYSLNNTFKPQQQQYQTTNTQLYQQVQQQTAASALPQRVRPTSASLITSQQQQQQQNTDVLSKRFTNTNTASNVVNTPTSTLITNDQPVKLPVFPKTNSSSKISVDTSIIHQALFTSPKTTNTNPVTFTVKI